MTVVLLTRPQAASEALMEQLQPLGYACVIEPLLEIEPVASPLLSTDGIQAVMITSANALDAEPSILNALLGMPCFCVGAKTADKARAFGFQLVFHTANDGTELAALIASTLIDKSKSILHIAGRDIDSKAQNALAEKDFKITTWIVYAAVTASRLTPSTLELLQENKISAVLLFSTRTAETLVTLIHKYGLEACCAGLDAIGFSASVTAALQPLPWHTTRTTSQPTEDAMIACLQEIDPAA